MLLMHAAECIALLCTMRLRERIKTVQQPSEKTPKPLLLTIQQVADQLGLSRAKVYTLLKEKQGPPVIRFGRSARVSLSSLRRWIEEQEREQQES
jgi:excisionase family DNA binding protein